MNRPLRFRAWDADLKQMMPSVDLSGPVSTYQWLGAYDLPLMQFTGLRDANGIEIFEGDVVRVEYYEAYSEVAGKPVKFVRFDRELRFSVCEGNYQFGLPMTWGGFKSLEVIGNIYENPELLSV